MVSLVINVVLGALVLGAACYYVVRWMFRKDTEIEDRRRAAAELAGVLSGLGLRKIPDFLIDYSVGDYSGMGKKIADLARLFLSGEAAVLEEFKEAFGRVLDAKLKTPEGRAYIRVKLEDSDTADPSPVAK